MTNTTDTAGRISQAELARRLNVSRGAVCKAVKSGRIAPDDEGLFDPTEAELQWIANTRQTAQRETATPKTGATSGGAYAQARARKEHALARMAELRLEQATGKLIPKADVDFALNDYGSTLRGLMESLPDRLAPILLGLRDLESIHSALAAAADEVLTELSENMERRALGVSAEGDIA